MLIVFFPADTVKYLPQKSELGKHCVFYLNKMFFYNVDYDFNCDGVSVIGQIFFPAYKLF